VRLRLWVAFESAGKVGYRWTFGVVWQILAWFQTALGPVYSLGGFLFIVLARVAAPAFWILFSLNGRFVRWLLFTFRRTCVKARPAELFLSFITYWV